MAIKSRDVVFKVESITKEEQENPYSSAGRYGDLHTARTGMWLVFNLRGTVDGKTAYLTKRIEFTRCVGISNGDFFWLDGGANENAWGKIIKEKGEIVKSATPEMFPDAFALVHRERFELKIQVGDTLNLVAIVSEKTSKAGKSYLTLKRPYLKGGAK